MNPEKLAKMAEQVRTGGKGSVRRKKKAIHKTTTTDDKRLQVRRGGWWGGCGHGADNAAPLDDPETARTAAAASRAGHQAIKGC